MVEMSCEEHDKIAAKSQFLTHTIGRYCIFQSFLLFFSAQHTPTPIEYLLNIFNLLFLKNFGWNGDWVHTNGYKGLWNTASIGMLFSC